VFGAGAAMYLENFSGVVDNLRQQEFIKTLKIMDDSGNVDAERLYMFFKAQAQKGPITFDIPMIGAVTLKESDVDKLYTCIMQA